MKRVAIIGAGASGLAAIKCCLDEGLEPVCYEKSGFIGGLWHYTEDVDKGRGCVMKSTVINTSKEMMCYSDYPIPTEFPPYMHHTFVDKYFHMYADHFGLKKYIQLNTEVVFLQRDNGFKTSGKWKLDVKSNIGECTETFDCVMVCTGHHADKYVPDFKGLKKFKNKVLHTHDYKDYHGFEDKNVLIIGIGNSGGDVANELSRISSQVFLSTRSGAWLFNRVAPGGIPFDMIIHTRSYVAFALNLPYIAAYLSRRTLNKKFDHRKYSLQPDHNPIASHPTTNDELPNKIISGRVIIKTNVQEFTETGAIFEDGSELDELDAVVMATGYVFGFPFIDNDIIEVKNNEVNLYLNMFPPDLDHQTLAVIGCFQPVGALAPVSEMQCRLATRTFKSCIKLPNKEKMWDSIKARHDAIRKRYKKSLRHTIQVEYIPYMDELASIVGCIPNFQTLLFQDPYLAFKCYFGPCTPYQYRLMGPGYWTGAKEAITTQWERTFKPLRTRHCKAPESDALNTTSLFLIIVSFFVSVLLFTYLFI